MLLLFLCFSFYSLFKPIESEQKDKENTMLINRYVVETKLFSPIIPLTPHYKNKLSTWDKRLRKYFRRAVNDTEDINMTIINFLVKKRFPPAIHLLGELNEIGYKNITQNITEAYRYYNIAAKLGYPVSLSSVAFYKRYGIATDQNIIESLLFDEIGAQLLSTKSIITSSFQYINGIHRVKSNLKAIQLLVKMMPNILMSVNKETYSESRSKLLNHNLLFGNAKDQMENYEYTFIKNLADHGNELAQIEIGLNKYAGKLGQTVDKKAALEMFSKNKNHMAAQAMIGRMFLDGDVLPKNLTKAREYLKKASGEPQALFDLGRLYSEQGNKTKALKYYQEAADKGIKGALFNYLLILLEDHKTNPVYYNQIRRLAEEDDIVNAQYITALYAFANYAPYNESLIIENFMKVAYRGPWMHNLRTAQKFLSKHDYNRSILIFMELADMGHGPSAYNAGLILMQMCNSHILGFDKTKSLEIAIKMFKIALRDKTIDQNEVSIKLLRAVAIIGDEEKKQKLLLKESSSNYKKYYAAKESRSASINEMLNFSNPMTKMPLNEQVAFQIDAFAYHLKKMITTHSILPFYEAMKWLISTYYSASIQLITLFVLILLVRKRIGISFS